VLLLVMVVVVVLSLRGRCWRRCRRYGGSHGCDGATVSD
jgi:hypothetical protein